MLVPPLGGANMQAILAVFHGEATLADAPEQVLDTTTVPAVEASTPTDPGTAGSTPGTVEPAPATTLPSVQADENLFGVVPDKNVSC